ncbi:MAG: hypothetical protein HRU17_09065 [Polyangiaceae bacterium]|nr:hypothetical protein [Polyangiaceae bacterium]
MTGQLEWGGIWLVASVLVLGGCRELDRFDTGDTEAYCGSVVGSGYVRAGFSQTMRMELTLDTDALQTQPGTIRSDDRSLSACSGKPIFDGVPLRVVEPVVEDALSTLEFGDSREFNFIALVDSCRGTMVSVVSLMKNDDVELRLLLPQAADVPEEPAYAVFRLKRSPRACDFD